ncbi:EAL domain-containing protein [Phenylobacterium sp.]|uniref:EAL domain-containing protein n=1 Tax=Phenylobacterium sp. TaxID=1871053 RepID=UPI002C82C685|nr:EAL domain-containing protein [Phenylobacterium sp.]HVI32327.1 EAL domain-containing protein [Phenylobacterium sp.]
MILKRLSRRLAALYAVLFGAGLFLAAVALFTAHLASRPAPGGGAPLLVTGALLCILGSAAVGLAGWTTLRAITRRVAELEAAARRLELGEDARLAPVRHDALAGLTESFNAMATATRDRERRITHLALHDAETGLPARPVLERAVDGLADRPHGHAYVATLGVRRFDRLRGAVGYGLAAQAVQALGRRLAGLAPASGVARIAPDVLGFTLVARGPDAALDDARRLLIELEHPLRLAGGEAVELPLDLGLSPLDPTLDATANIELASIALDQVRGLRRGVAFFDAEAYGDPAANLSLMSALARALEDGGMELHYQPKFDLRLRQVTAVEALARWRHPVRGLLHADRFVAMAEETGHIRELNIWALRRAIGDQKVLAAAGHAIEMALNISARTLAERDFADFALAEASAARGRLTFEVTEAAVIDNPELAPAALERLAAAGLGLAIDDFGAGLSSLGHLKAVRAHELKIDRSIVRGLGESRRDGVIVRSAIELAHGLGLKVTAQGVETEACFARLSAMGCDQAQGYLLGRPMPLGELLTFLEAPFSEDRRRA